MKLHLGIDTALLAVPNYAASQAEAEEIIQRIVHWAKPALFGELFQGVMLSDAITLLSEQEYFPTGPNIQALLELWNLRHVYSTEDVRRSINFILERSLSSLEEWRVEVEEATLLDSQPSFVSAACDEVLFGATLRLAITTELARAMMVQNLPVMIVGFPDGLGAWNVRATANSGQVESFECLDFPVTVRSNIQLVNRVDDLTSFVAANVISRTAEDSLQLHFAISIRILELTRASGSPLKLSEVPPFILGSDFFNSLNSNGATGGRSSFDVIIESCARVVMSDPKNRIGSLNKRSHTGKYVPVVRSRDGSVAQRTHLTKGHEALRLLFWRRPDGVCEFANVGPKGELVIVDGNPAATIDGGAYVF